MMHAVDLCTQERFDQDVLDRLFEWSERSHSDESIFEKDLLRFDPLNGACLDALMKRFKLREMQDGVWVRSGEIRWRVRWLRAEDENAWFKLFASAFGHDMPVEFWRWKYRHMKILGTCVWNGDELVAFFGGMSRPIQYLGQPAQAVQIGDVMVHPKERGVMTRQGPFQMAAATYLERCVGHDRPYLLGFGFPTLKALKLAEKIGLYHVTDEMVELVWNCESAGSTVRWGSRTLEPLDHAVAEKLWRDMAQDFRADIIGVRDWTYLQERYLMHPTVNYHCHLVNDRLTRQPLGVLVFRDTEDPSLELVDLIGKRSRFEALIRFARGYARRRGKVGLKIWVTRSHASYLDHGAPTLKALDLWVPGNAWSPGPSRETVAGRWWLTGGDTDFR